MLNIPKRVLALIGSLQACAKLSANSNMKTKKAEKVITALKDRIGHPLRTAVPLVLHQDFSQILVLRLPIVTVVKILKKNWGHQKNFEEWGGASNF